MRYILVPLRALSAEPLPSLHVIEPVRTAEPHDYDVLGHWVAAACASIDACIVVDAGGTVAALSSTASDLLGTNGDAVGQHLDEVLHLVDFGEGAREARGMERRIPPLIAVRENSLSRGVIRVRRPDGARLMLDAVAAPIHDVERRPVGAVSFLVSV